MKKMSLLNKTIVITAGPTREAIDPIRYISNHSSGKMGYNLAISAVNAGAKVILISGPCCLNIPDGLTAFVPVVSSKEMLIASKTYAVNADIFIACAAVADYSPKQVATQKLKKSSSVDTFSLELVKNPDIVATIKQIYPSLCVVGFAAETTNLLEYARIKLASKNLDMIIANNVANGEVFGNDQNQVSVITKDGKCVEFELQDKSMLADKLIQYIANKFLFE